MNKSLVWVALCIAALLAACGPAALPGPTTAPAGQAAAGQTITGQQAIANNEITILRFAVSGIGQARYENLIQAFEAENPGVRITTVSIEETLGGGRALGAWPDDAYLLLASAADVIAAPATGQAVQQGALLDLTHFFESDANLKPEAFYPGLVESMQWEGRIWSVPTEVTYPLIYFDKSLFDTAGVAYPQPGWTWDDFLATAQALTLRSGDTVSQWGFVQPSFEPIPFIQARAGLLFNADTYPPTARLEDPAVIEAVRWYTGLFQTYEVSPYYAVSGEGGPGGMFGNEGMRLMTSGQAAMWYTGQMGQAQVVGRGMQQGFQQQAGIGAVPFPISKTGDRSNPAVVDGLSISAGTRHAELAWKWISFLAQQPGAQRGPLQALSSGTLPALPSVAAAGGYWNNLDEEVAAALQFAIEHAYVDNYDGVGYDTFTNAVVAVLDQGVDVAVALADAQSRVEAEIEAAAAAAPTPVANLVVAAAEQKAIDAGAVIIDFGLREAGGRFGQQSLSALVEQFQADHPDIVVQVQAPAGFRGQADLVQMAAEYDCFQALPTLNEESIASVINLEPFLAADPGTGKEDFYASAVEQLIYQGQLWGLPGSVTVPVINYNKDLFDAAGLPYPSSTWTTSDFLEAAVALTQGEGETRTYGFAPSTYGTDDLVSILDRLGADMLDQSVDPPRLVFNTPSVIDAFRWYTSLATRYQVVPVYEGAGGMGRGEGQRQALINQGRVAMWVEGGTTNLGGFGRMGQLAGGGQLNQGVAPLPSGPNSAQGSGFQSVDGYFISAQSDARQACWTWITFLTEQPSMASGLPARRSAAESAAYRQRVGEEQAAVYVASVSSGSRASFFQRISEEGTWLGFASNWLSAAYSRVLNGEMTVEEALNDAQESVDSYRNCVIARSAYQDPAGLMACLGEAGMSMSGPRQP
jgi:multiple sugar transport system substrate-binding protein